MSHVLFLCLGLSLIILAAGGPSPDGPVGGEGDKCSPHLPQPYLISCAEGLFCDIALPGGNGTCAKCTPEKCEPAQFAVASSGDAGQTHKEKAAVGEGEKCNPSLAPPFAIDCIEGFYCSVSLTGASGTCTKCTQEKCHPPLLTSASKGPQDGPLSEGDVCNPSLPPSHARFCGQGLFCSSALPGEAGTCTKCTPEMCEPVQFDSPIAVGQVHPEKATVGEGETCNPSLPPGYATFCADGLYCNSASQDGMARPGVAGICATCTPEACEPPQFDGIEGNAVGQVHLEKGGVVGEGESCNPSLPPAYATACADGLYCRSGLPDSAVPLGAAGTCAKCTPEKCEPLQISAGEGEVCNPSLPPTHAILCRDGLYCTPGTMRGAHGICRTCTPQKCGGSP